MYSISEKKPLPHKSVRESNSEEKLAPLSKNKTKEKIHTILDNKNTFKHVISFLNPEDIKQFSLTSKEIQQKHFDLKINNPEVR
tara:strand:+ start:259 stop:510 length:252 start_codon:yes stop_codon:yes gene_type:complete